MSARNAVQFLV